MAARFAQPGNEDEFEDFCLRFYRKRWSNEGLRRYGKRGQRQFGIDIHDPIGMKPVSAVQCKHHEPTKSLKPAEIWAEVEKAEGWDQPLERYVIGTTARKSREAQDAVAKLNARPEGERKFIVEIYFWEEFCEFLSGLDPVQAYSIVHGHDVGKDLVSSLLENPSLRAMARAALKVSETEEKDGAYGDIEALLTARNLDAARHEIEKLPKGDELDQLDAAERYKITRLRAKLALEDGDFDLASQLFLDAFELQPDLAQAKQNQVLAYALSKDREKAFSLARQYIQEGLDSPIMLSRVVEASPTREQLDEVLPLLETHLESDEDVNVALTHRLIGFGDHSAARIAGERAARVAPNSPHAHFAAGSAAHNEAANSEGSKRKADLSYALEHYNAAEKLATEMKYGGILPEILINRGAVHGMLQNEAAAKADYTASVKKASDPSPYAENAASYFLSIRDPSGAEELLSYLDKGSNEGRFFSALIECDLAKDDEERRGCVRELAILAEKDWERSVECRLHCVEKAIRLRDWELARSVISEEFEKTHPFQANTALAWIAAESKVGDPAEFAHKAVAAGMADTEPPDRRVLADILVAIGDHATALTLLEQNIVPGVFDGDTRKLIECSQQVRRHDLLLRLCRELREAGEQPVELRQLEMELLNRYAPERGLELVDRFIEAGERRGYFVAFKNCLAVRLGRLELVDFEGLPTPKELKPSQALLVTFPYLETNRIDEGIAFLYGQLRLNFDDPEAHENYTTFIFQHGNKGSQHISPERVEGECAVRFELSDGSSRWVVIENDAPARSRGECSSESALAKGLEGKEVGESLTLPSSFGTPEQATVREIQTKYLRAFRDSIDNFSARFPEDRFFQAMNMGSGEELDLTELIEASKKQKQSAEQCVRFYMQNPCTLFLLAERLGLSEREVIFALSQYQTGRVRCTGATGREFKTLADNGIANENVILTISAITTLGLLDGWELLDKTKHYFVSRATWELLYSWVAKAVDGVDRETAHTSLTDEGELQVYTASREELEQRREAILSLKRHVEALCTISSAAESTASVEPKKRSSYEEAVGFHNLEAICLAKNLGGAFWSDDAMLSVFAKLDFDVTSVWTQLVLKVNAKAGVLSDSTYNLASAKLVGLQYENLVWNVSTITQAGELAGWDPGRWPFKQCIRLVGLENIETARRVRLVVDVLRSLRASSCGVLRSSPVVQELLTAVRNRLIVATMYEHLAELFGGDVITADFFAPEFEYWLNHNIS